MDGLDRRDQVGRVEAARVGVTGVQAEPDVLEAARVAQGVPELGDAVEVVIPKEASVAAPYAISLVKNGPNPNAGKLWLNFIMSEAGQTLFAQGFVRPAVPGTPLSADVAAKMPAAPQIRPLDVVKASERKAEVDRLWALAALGSK